MFSNTKVRCRDHILIKMSSLMKGGSNDTTETSKMKGASLEFFSPFFLKKVHELSCACVLLSSGRFAVAAPEPLRPFAKKIQGIPGNLRHEQLRIYSQDIM